MISLQIMFYIFVAFFAFIGYMRGWEREVIALTGLIASLAALNQFGYIVLTRLPLVQTPLAGEDPTLVLLRNQFWLQASVHVVVAFFSYQVVARLAGNVRGGKLGERLRANLENRFVGGVIGGVNGYLLVGGLWSFLEYRLTETGYERLPQEFTRYAFDLDIITRPAFDSAAWRLCEHLPLGAVDNPTWWLVFFFVAFFIVIVALI
jgi:uncharacterized membrane protein required for colicin V production